MPLLFSEIKGKLCADFTSLKCCLLQAWLLEEFLIFIKIKISNEKEPAESGSRDKGCGILSVFLKYKYCVQEGENGQEQRGRIRPLLDRKSVV